MELIGIILLVSILWLARAILGVVAFFVVAFLIVSALQPALPTLLKPLFRLLPEDPDMRFNISVLLATGAVVLIWAIRDRRRLIACLRR